MLWHRPTQSSFLNRAADSAGHAIEATRTGANHTLDSVSHGIDNLRERATGHVGQLADRSSSLVRQGSRRLRDSAGRASDSTALYIREEPLKAVAFAAVTGAIIALLASWLGSSSRER